MRKRKEKNPLPNETSEELRARLRRFALVTREEALHPATTPFPENVTALAGPLRKAQVKAFDAHDGAGQDSSNAGIWDDQKKQPL